MSQPKPPSNFTTIVFVVVLCLSCALVLSLLASILKVPQEQAAKVDRAKQTLLAARIIDYDGLFLLRDESGDYQKARHVGNGKLEMDASAEAATDDDILTVFKARIEGWLVDKNGKLLKFDEAGVDETSFVDSNWQDGYTDLDKKLVYKILPNPNGNSDGDSEGWILPVAGFGLWNKIVGYVAMEPDGVFVKGIAWYWHRETPGLGGDIVEQYWQKQFPGKSVFQFTGDSMPDLQTTPVGITVVRGAVADVYGNSPKSRSAVDGLSGATLTGVGVTKAYKETFEAYRPFLIRVHNNEIVSSNQSKGATHG